MKKKQERFQPARLAFYRGRPTVCQACGHLRLFLGKVAKKLPLNCEACLNDGSVRWCGPHQTVTLIVHPGEKTVRSFAAPRRAQQARPFWAKQRGP